MIETKLRLLNAGNEAGKHASLVAALPVHAGGVDGAVGVCPRTISSHETKFIQ